MHGACGPEIYGPDYILQHDVVLVTINYRVGVLGEWITKLFVHSLLTINFLPKGFASFTDPSLAIPGNAGLRDQLMAIKWIKKNIENFGGDADNITLSGQSAGANSVHFLMLTENARGCQYKLRTQWAYEPDNIPEMSFCFQDYFTGLL